MNTFHPSRRQPNKRNPCYDGNIPRVLPQTQPLFLHKMREACERYRIFIKRLELADDPAAREYLRATNAQMLEGGFTMQAMFQG